MILLKEDLGLKELEILTHDFSCALFGARDFFLEIVHHIVHLNWIFFIYKTYQSTGK